MCYFSGRQGVTLKQGVAFFQGLWRFDYGAADQDIGLAETDDLTGLLDATAKTP